jgi:IS605 OrfB family transposase
MPTRSIKLKLVIPRDSSAAAVSVRRALWTTHAYVNAAVRYYTELLLELRQEDVLLREGNEEKVVEAATWTERLRARLHTTRIDPARIESALAMCKQLYREIIPSTVEGKKGNAQVANRYMSPLLDAKSRGQATENAGPLAELRRVEGLPLAAPYNAGQLEAVKRGAIHTFDRMAFALAAAHLNPWESSRHRTVKQYTTRKARRDSLAAWFRDNAPDAMLHLERFERSRLERLRLNGSLADEDTVYAVTLRELRAWDKLRAWLAKHPDADHSQRRTFVTELQAREGRGFGGAEVMQWLAQPEQQFLATHEAGDVVSRWGLLNRAKAVFERTKRDPALTHADARRHPRYVAFDAPPNTNAPQFDLKPGDAGIRLTLPLLVASTETGLLERTNVEFTLAPSRQVRDVKVRDEEQDGKRHLKLEFRSQDGLDQDTADVGGSVLLFDRPTVAGTRPHALEAGTIGPAWFKLSVSVGDANEAQLKENEAKGTWVNSGPQKRANSSRPTRVLAADLGVRTAASCAVFTFAARGRAGTPVTLATGDTVVHERSMKLALPGEQPDARTLAARAEADRAVRAIRAGIGMLKTLRKLARAADAETRATLLDALEHGRPGTTPPPITLPPESLAAWRAAASDSLAALVTGPWRDARMQLAVEIRRWRRETRRRRSSPLGGKSAWAVEYLERVRKTLLSWAAMRGPDQPDIKRFDRGRQGTYARRLLDHITALKKDRVKTTADLIVQAARGLVHVDGRWEQKHQPCEVIVLEDLGRYRFQTDRPRSENSQLMRWSHREVLAQVKQQAAVYGIAVIDTPAAFSSRFDAITRAPGLRCEHVDQPFLALVSSPEGERRRAELERLEIDCGRLQLGDLVPRAGGEQFVSVLGGRPVRVRVRHADINAAQNLALRALEAHQSPVRLTAAAIGDSFVTRPLGVRNQAVFAGQRVVLESASPGGKTLRATSLKNDREAAKRLGIKPGDLDNAKDDEQSSGPDDDDDDAEFAARLQAVDDAAKKRETFFRDPSGVVLGGSWAPGVVFWSEVRRLVIDGLRTTTDKAGRRLLHG